MTPLIKLAEVMAITKKSRSSVYAEAKDGRFPKPIKLSSAQVLGLNQKC